MSRVPSLGGGHRSSLDLNVDPTSDQRESVCGGVPGVAIDASVYLRGGRARSTSSRSSPSSKVARERSCFRLRVSAFRMSSLLNCFRRAQKARERRRTMRAVPPAAEAAMMAVRSLEEGEDTWGIVLGIMVWVCRGDVGGSMRSGDEDVRVLWIH